MVVFIDGEYFLDLLSFVVFVFLFDVEVVELEEGVFKLEGGVVGGVEGGEGDGVGVEGGFDGYCWGWVGGGV